MWADDAEYRALVDKLWCMTGFSQLDPQHGYLERMKYLQSLSQQIGIERAHQMELLHNDFGDELEIADEERLAEVRGRRVSQSRRQGVAGYRTFLALLIVSRARVPRLLIYIFAFLAWRAVYYCMRACMSVLVRPHVCCA